MLVGFSPSIFMTDPLPNCFSICWTARVSADSRAGSVEMPGGRVDVGESAVEAAVREVLEEAGVHVLVTGIAGLFTDPGHVVCAANGEVRQQFVVVFGARWQRGVPCADLTETSEARWVTPAELPALRMEPPVRAWVQQALAVDEPPYLG